MYNIIKEFENLDTETKEKLISDIFEWTAGGCHASLIYDHENKKFEVVEHFGNVSFNEKYIIECCRFRSGQFEYIEEVEELFFLCPAESYFNF